MWVDCDESSETMGFDKFKQLYNLPTEFPGFMEGFEYKRDIDNIISEIVGGKATWHGARIQTVVLDNLTELQQRLANEIVETDSSVKRAGGELAGMQDFRKSQNHVMHILRELRYRARTVNVIATVDDRNDEDKTTGSIKTRMGLTPALIPQASRLFTVIGRLVVEQGGRRVMQFTPQDRQVLGIRDRSRSLPDTMPNPTMAEIYNIIRPTLSKDVA